MVLRRPAQLTRKAGLLPTCRRLTPVSRAAER
jgi:hypothetical protein